MSHKVVTKELQIQVDPGGAVGTLLRFAQTRSELTVRTAAGQVQAGHHGFQFAIHWNQAARDSGSQAITVQYTGATPMLTSTAALDVLQPDMPLLEQSESDVLEERLRLIKTVKDPRIHGLMMSFYRIDAATRPSELMLGGANRQSLAASITRLRNFLPRRVMFRAASAREGKPFDPGDLDKPLLTDLARVSRHLRQLLSTEFGDQVGAIDEARLGAAFEAFVGGDLDLRPFGGAPEMVNQGAPDGSLFFAFAEFSLACQHNDMEKDFWQTTLRVFVRVCEMFVQLYWHGSDRTEHSYLTTYRGARKFGPEARERLRIAFATRPVSRLTEDFGDIAAAAFRDEAHEFFPDANVASAATGKPPADASSAATAAASSHNP